MFDDWGRRRAGGRVKPGDGRVLQPFRWWHLPSGRKLFYLERPDATGRPSRYALDVRHWGKQGGEDARRAHLFHEGRHVAESPLPAAFPIEGGTIEVAMSEAGLRRMHFVPSDGPEVRLDPDPASAVGRRVAFDRAHPAASRTIGALSVLALVIGVGLNILQILEPLSEVPPIADRFGTFTSPVHLPLWLNVALAMAAGFGASERALRLRYRWWLDGAGT